MRASDFDDKRVASFGSRRTLPGRAILNAAGLFLSRQPPGAAAARAVE
jgi:hypothetical protein